MATTATDWVDVINRQAMAWYSLLRPQPPAVMPAPAPYVFDNVPSAPAGGLTTNTVLLLGLAVVGVYLLTR